MSGRKQSEVAAVLKQGEQARSMTNELIRSVILNGKNIIVTNSEKLTRIINKAEKTTCNVDKNAKDVFKDKAESLQKDFDNTKKGIFSAKIDSSKAKKIEDEFAELQRNIANCDRRAADIREKIKNKPGGYCDSEYDAAKKLVQEYKDIRSKMQNLEREMSDISNKANSVVNKAEAQSKKLDSLKEQIDNMNSAAKLHKESSAIKKKIQDSLESVDKKWVDKFFKEEFANISADIASFSTKEDKEILAEGSIIYGNLSDFVNKLNNRIAQYQQEKADAENLFESLSASEKVDFYDPIDYQNKGKSAKKISLFSYIRTYAKEDLEGTYDRLMDDAYELIEDEKFVEAVAVMQKADVEMKVAMNKARELQERMLKSADLAYSIAEVMHDMHYDINAESIDGNPEKGFRVVCSYGDEVIDFDNVKVDEDGNVVVSLDHHEGGNGIACEHTWDDIRKKMVEAGLPITDVKKNGFSILKKQQIVQQDQSKIRARG